MRVFSNRPGSNVIRHRPIHPVHAGKRTHRPPNRYIARACGCALEALESRTLLSSVTQYHNDAPSTGQNLTEISLTPANVNSNTFGKLSSTTVDGQVYAQPLYVPSVNITAGSYQGTHNVTFVATENDSLYAIDSNSGTILWHQSFLVNEPGLANVTAVSTVSSTDVNTTDINPMIGITGTPVIDGGYIYLAAATKQIVSGNTTSPHFVYTLYKVALGSGAYTSTVIGDTTFNTSTSAYTFNSGPYVLDPQGQGAGEVTATINGTSQKVVYFNALRANNRAALTAYNGNIYIAFASHGDNTPYHGWILGYSESSLTPTAVFNANPNGSDTGIWQGGGAISIDPQGYMYVETGNGTFDTTMNAAGFPVYGDYGDSFIKIALDSTTSQTNQNINGWGLKVVDYFTPQNQASLSSADEDLGSGGPLILPASIGSITIGSASAPNLLVGSGKDGTIYLINRNNMGKYNSTTDNIVQEIGGGLGGGGSYDTPSFYYNGTSAIIFYAAKTDNMRAFTIANGLISTTPLVSPDIFGLQGATLSISANGDSDGIVWGIDGGTSELRAYNASNIAAGAIYSTATNSSRDSLGTAVKFTVPTVADGEVFVGTTNSLVVYGLLAPPTSAPTAPNSLQATAVSNVQINLTWTDTATNAFGYYVEESADNGNTWSQVAALGPTATTYSVIGLQPNTPYTFRVQAYNSVGDSAYTKNASATTTNNAVTVNYPSGFSGQNGLTLNGSASVNGSALELTNGGSNEAASAFNTNVVSVQGFNTTFNFQLVNPNADGFAFTLQGDGPKSIGNSGGALGYATIAESVAIKFDLYSNNGEGTDSTGLFVDGDMPSSPTSGDNPADTSIDMTSSGVNLHSGDVMSVNLTYNGVTLTETVTDTTTKAAFTHSYTINIPSFIGSGYGYVGFTAGTGGETATQNILSWTYSPVAVTPYTPVNLAVNPASGTELDLSWAEPYSAVTNFNILELINGSYSQIGQVGGGTTAFASTGLNVGGIYSYKVVASNSAGNSAPAGPVTGTTPTPPANPINLLASNITTSGVTLTWQDEATNATGYVITRQLESDSSQYVTTLPNNATSYTDTNLLPGRAYDYEVAATNLAGPSAGISVDIETVPPAPTVSTPVVSGNQITLNWIDAGHAVTGYNIYRGNSSGGENYASPINGGAPVTGTIFNDTGLTGGSTYYYTVEAVNTGGSSTPSNEVTATTGPSIATPAAANPNPVTGTSTALSALGSENGSSSGLNYTWSATGPASVSYSGNTNGTNAAKNITANFTKAGSYNFTVTITDSGGAFTTSSVAVTVQQTPTGVIVTPSSATVATGGTKQFSATATDQFGNAISSPTFNWSITGTGNGNSINAAGLATLGSTPGTYTVTASLGSASKNASVTAAVAPIVSTFQVNDGSVQRAMVDSLTVTLNEAVTLSTGAITLNLLSQTGGASTPMSFTLTPGSGSSTTFVLTFTGSSYIGGSLPDGAYELIVSSGGVISGQGLNMSANQNFTFWRLYGDFEGLGTVNGGDFTLLVTELGTHTNSSDWYLDYEGAGAISGSDFAAFVGRLGKSISIPSLPSVELLAAAPPVTTSISTTTTAMTNKQTSDASAVPRISSVAKPASKQKLRHGHGG
ncbi:MAG: fibronectin type III domain-containing protein [Tepidisphaeraceae bacterium]